MQRSNEDFSGKRLASDGIRGIRIPLPLRHPHSHSKPAGVFIIGS